MKALDLFSGSQSWGNVLREKGYDVISVDICDYKGKFIPTHLADILLWDYKQYNKNEFDIITAGPPCIWYSNLQHSWYGKYKVNPKTKQKYLYTKEKRNEDLKFADSLVKKTLEIIEYFKPKLWFIENPQTGLLKKRGILDQYKYYDVDYCAYGFDYRKRTRIWTNKDKDFEPQLCKKKLCHSIIRFNENNKSDKFRMMHNLNFSRDGPAGICRSKVPKKLIEQLLK